MRVHDLGRGQGVFQLTRRRGRRIYSGTKGERATTSVTRFALVDTGYHWRLTVTADEFRNLALSLPEASEGAHMDHPDFRVGGKIFATLWPDGDWGMVKLTAEQQAVFTRSEPKVFQA